MTAPPTIAGVFVERLAHCAMAIRAARSALGAHLNGVHPLARDTVSCLRHHRHGSTTHPPNVGRGT